MNVEGLTRENVASHLQKWRLQTKRWEPREEGGAAGCGASGEGSPPPQSRPRAGREASSKDDLLTA